MQTLKFFTLSAAALIVFDAVASLASLATGFPYVHFAFGSAALYIVCGFLCAKRSGLGLAVLLGAVMGLTDATLGWAVSWAIGVGALPPGSLTPLSWPYTAAFVITLGAIYGFAGGSFGAFIRRRREA